MIHLKNAFHFLFFAVLPIHNITVVNQAEIL